MPRNVWRTTLTKDHTAVPSVVSVVETSATEQSSLSSVRGEKTVRPASAKVRAKTVRAKAHASTESAKARTKTARTRVVHTAVKSKKVDATPRRASADRVRQYADQTFSAQPVVQYSSIEPAKPVRIRRTGRHRSLR